MKKYLIGLIILSSIPAFAQSREIRVTTAGDCSSIVPTGELGIFLQKSQVKSCAKDDALESLYRVCQDRHGGELVDHGRASIIGCSSKIVWGGREVYCGAKIVGKCLVN